MTTANITVYLQALGGHFLGPHAYNTADIKLTLTLDGNTSSITYTYPQGGTPNDGQVGSTFCYPDLPTNGLTVFEPILTPAVPNDPSPAVNYLTPIDGTICGYIEAEVSQLEVLGTLSASIPRPGGPDLVLTQSIALNQYQAEYRPILIVPGLLLQKPEPPVDPQNRKSLFLYVKMMCGCPITATGQNDSDWREYDFVVSAEVFLKNGQRTPNKSLVFTSNATPSLFELPVADVQDIQMVNFTAIQKSTGNIGFLSVIYALC